MRDKSRASLATEDKSTARRIFDEILKGGAKAAKRKTGEIKVGKWADLISLDENHINLIQAKDDMILDCFAFSSKTTKTIDLGGQIPLVDRVILGTKINMKTINLEGPPRKRDNKNQGSDRHTALATQATTRPPDPTLPSRAHPQDHGRRTTTSNHYCYYYYYYYYGASR